MFRRANHFLLLAIAVLLYLELPIFAGVFAIGDREGPSIYSRDYHSFLYITSYEIVRNEKPRLRIDANSFGRPLFYGLPRPRLAAESPDIKPRPIPTPEKKNATCDFSEFSPLKIGAGCVAPKVSLPRPAYPPEAKERGLEGTVRVLLLVNVKTGVVEQACVIEGDEVLNAAAKEAGMRVRFSPFSPYLQKRYTYAQQSIAYNFVNPSRDR